MSTRCWSGCRRAASVWTRSKLSVCACLHSCFPVYLETHFPFTQPNSKETAFSIRNSKRVTYKECKIWALHGGDYEEWRHLGHKTSDRTSQEKRYVSATVSSRLMLYKIWDLHCCDYEECRLLGYKNPVYTSQEKHYVSATEPSRLM
jgi:hypothetical protein